LPPHHTLIVPDLIGFGDSSPLRRGQHAEAEARALLVLMDREGVESFDLVGHDFGGPVALWLWHLAPERVRTIALIATNAFRDTPIPGVLQVARIPGLGEAVFRLLMSRIGLLIMWRQATGDRAAYPLRSFRECLVSDSGVRSTREVFLLSLRELDRLYREVEDALPTIRVPSVVIWGERDPFFPVTQGQRLAKAIAPGAFAVLRGCGHFVPQERPAEVARCLADLWRRG
jgi:pimeloyl-ACP methyl ester carboxylesterase